MRQLGLDLGTKHIVLAYLDDAGGVKVRYEVNGYLTLERGDAFTEQLLVRSGVPFVRRGEEIIAIGGKAEKLAYTFNKTLSRPMAHGGVQMANEDAQEIIAIIIKSIIGKLNDDTTLYYCTTAKPVNSDLINIDFHKRVVKLIIESYQSTEKKSDGSKIKIQANHINEARCLILDEPGAAIGISWGAGTVTVNASVFGVPIFEFSVSGCLAEDFPIITNNGIKKICEVNIGDMVLEPNGKFAEVSNKINNGKRDKLIKINLNNLPGFEYKMTSDHRIFMKDGYEWKWREAKNIKPGDIIGEPVIKFSGLNDLYIGYEKLKTKQLQKAKSRNLGRIVGAFLGDGNANQYKECGGYVELDFTRGDIKTIEKYKKIIFDLFEQNSQEENSREEKLTSIKLHNLCVTKYFKKFYREDGTKYFPEPVHEITDQMALGIIEGVIDTDGNEPYKCCYEINNTSLDIILLVHQLLNRFNIVHSIMKRDPREGGVNNKGVRIVGKKDCYVIRINELSTNILNGLLMFEGSKIYINKPDFMEYSVESVEEVNYNSDVWDLTVSSDSHAFASPGMVEHNCGDWIDEETAKRFGFNPDKPGMESIETPTTICRRKESLDLSKMPEDNVGKAITLMYEILIENVVKYIAKGLKENKDKFRFDQPIPVVNAGGTCMPDGFMDFFKKKIDQMRDQLVLPIGEIRRADDPLFAVAKGCLKAAILAKEK